MQIVASGNPLAQIEADVFIIPLFKDAATATGLLAHLDEATDGQVASVLASGEADSRSGHSLMLHTPSLNTKRLLFYGAGDGVAASALDWQRLAGAAIRQLDSPLFKTVAFLLPPPLDNAAAVKALVEGALMGDMEGNLYHTAKEPARQIETLTLVSQSANAERFESVINEATVMAEAANFARHLGFEPGNEITPTTLAEQAQVMAEREGLLCEIFGEDEMKQLGMGALLAVSRGSEEPARFIILKHEPAEADASELIALVGKGITFDSGGISIKPAQAMEEMKYDMGGGAAVIGAMQIIARLKPNVRVMGLIAAAENLPSGRAYKPGDVVRSLSGKTIEVINTDAEGRVVLSDALTYAVNQGATQIVDAATLTGACVVALGDVRAALYGSDEKLIADLQQAGDECGERLWAMPLDSEYGGMIKSDIADVRNSGGRVAGSITAAMFLKSFAGNVPWAHLDIAGTAWFEDEKPYLAKGATGFGARLMAHFVLNQAKAARQK
ncbi:MAG: leucyl aminopeptidase [Acidobacteria bacterium]|nr:leucyl aminopeptidase [Acidobacteriota bacterium]